MKIKISYTVEINKKFRRAIKHYYGEPGLASSKDVQRWYWMHGQSVDEDLRSEHGKCCWKDKD